ncbi:MAG: excalibur calcium-binding domain-containing protein [Thermomicrobiales bacterium]
MKKLRHLGFLPILPFLLVMVMAIPGEHSLAAAATKNCSDFNSEAEAQSYFDTQGGSKTNNVDSLDADHDGIACENLKHGGMMSMTGDSATGGGLGTGIAIGVVICLAVIAGLILWLYKRRPTSSGAFSTGTGSYSPSRPNPSFRPSVDSDDTTIPAGQASSADPISATDDPYSPESLGTAPDSMSAKDDPYSPENLGTVTASSKPPAPVDEDTPPALEGSIGSASQQPMGKVPPPVHIAATGMLVFTVKTADGASIPTSAKLSIGEESRSVAASTGLPTSDLTLELPVGSLSYTITGTARHRISMFRILCR